MSPISRLPTHFSTPTPPAPSSSSPIKIQLLSDIHLEVASQYTTYTFPQTAPYLLLAGDIGNLAHRAPYLAFLTTLVPKYTRIFLLLGNHDFYGLTYEDGIAAAEAL
ncbi:metallophosphoesterase, partial [Candidatus Bathyarchaeota archaeon]|nr:metallophosphoesterase [Candidatus Bathyarchaeota archaeon]